MIYNDSEAFLCLLDHGQIGVTLWKLALIPGVGNIECARSFFCVLCCAAEDAHGTFRGISYGHFLPSIIWPCRPYCFFS